MNMISVCQSFVTTTLVQTNLEGCTAEINGGGEEGRKKKENNN